VGFMLLIVCQPWLLLRRNSMRSTFNGEKRVLAFREYNWSISKALQAAKLYKIDDVNIYS
jgi:hypothetical protein